MEWRVSRDGCFTCEHKGHYFELGEMGRGQWLLKHWHNSPRSVWYDVKGPEDGKAKAEELSQ